MVKCVAHTDKTLGDAGMLEHRRDQNWNVILEGPTNTTARLCIWYGLLRTVIASTSCGTRYRTSEELTANLADRFLLRTTGCGNIMRKPDRGDAQHCEMGSETKPAAVEWR